MIASLEKAQNSLDRGDSIDKMVDGTSITHALFDYEPKLANELIPMIVKIAKDDPPDENDRRLLDRCVDSDRWELAKALLETRVEALKKLSSRRRAILSVIRLGDANWLELVLSDD